MRRSLSVVVCLVALLVAAWQTNTFRSAAHPVNPEESPWLAVDLTGMPESTRKAVYDPTRDCLWIVSMVAARDNRYTQVATVTRVDTTTGVVTQTGVELKTRQFYQSAITVDASGNLWMAWDRVLVRFDPSTNGAQTYSLPSYASLGLHPWLWSGEGTFMAVGIDADGEIWTVADHVAAIFGFNPSLGRWDHVFKLPWVPYDTIQFPRPGTLTIGGARSADGKTYYGRLAIVHTASGRLSQYSVDAYEYTLADSHTAVFIDGHNNVGKLDLDTGHITILDREAAGGYSRSRLATGSGRQVWYGMGTGVNRVDVATGVVTRYEFPLVVPTERLQNVCADIRGPVVRYPDTGQCLLPCPTGVQSCIPKPYTPYAEINELIVDGKGDVWAVTQFPGSDDQHVRLSGPLRAVMELPASAV